MGKSRVLSSSKLVEMSTALPEEAWRMTATKRAIKAYDEAGS